MKRITDVDRIKTIFMAASAGDAERYLEVAKTILECRQIIVKVDKPKGKRKSSALVTERAVAKATDQGA